MRKSRSVIGAIALALACPAAVRAAGAPAMPGEVVGMSELPGPVQDSLLRQAHDVGGQLGRLRRQTSDGHIVFSADVVGSRAEIVTVERNGRLLSRRAY
jgi:hypothetical protein